MVREIIKDPIFLAVPSTEATAEDLETVKDLVETLTANREICVGMAANMIGESKRIIAVNVSGFVLPMLNPRITKKSGPYQAEEGCLSLEGKRSCTRYREIEVEYQDRQFKWHKSEFKDWTAQIIQHECDHLEGILI